MTIYNRLLNTSKKLFVKFGKLGEIQTKELTDQYGIPITESSTSQSVFIVKSSSKISLINKLPLATNQCEFYVGPVTDLGMPTQLHKDDFIIFESEVFIVTEVLDTKPTDINLLIICQGTRQ